MNTLERILELLPPPYSIANDSVLAQLVDAFALEYDAIQEDIERLRRTHWVNQAYDFEDLRKIAALCGVEPLPYETLETLRARLLPMVEAMLSGALGPADIRLFVETYLRNAEHAYSSVFLPGLLENPVPDPWTTPRQRPLFRPLALEEFPERPRSSPTLRARGGLVPALFRWTETNTGLEHAIPTLRLVGLGGRRTTAPLIANLTTGDMILFPDRIDAGSELLIAPRDATDRTLTATLNGEDVSARLKSLSGFVLGTPFSTAQFDQVAQVPPLPRGSSEWIYLSLGLYDVRGLDTFSFALADDALREGAFDETSFDHALFPAGPMAQLELSWREREAASFEVVVPRTIVSEPAGADLPMRPHLLVADALERSIGALHAAGVRAVVRFVPFKEVQRQQVRHWRPWVLLDPEQGPAGRNDRFDFGFRLGEGGLGTARFE
jgi:hypothetical protein